MVDRKSRLAFFSKRRFLWVVLLFIIAFQQMGCAAGYYTYKMTDESIMQPTQNLSDIKISYFTGRGSSLSSSIERTLRERFHVIDIKKLEDTNFKNDTDRIELRAKYVQKDPSLINSIWGYASLISLSTIPAIINQDCTATFVIIAPNGDEKTFQYQFTAQFYNWLPFLFLAPDFYYVFLNGRDDNKKLEIFLDHVTTRFIVEATPFILSHAKRAN